jgi:glycosyltransferase involved in cell wall biosynthesis
MDRPSQPPRVAFLGYAHDARGGIAQFGRGLAEVVATEADVRLLGYRKLYPAFTKPGRQGPDPSVRPSPLAGPSIPVPWAPRTWRAANAELRRFRADLLVVHWWSPLFGPSVRSIVRRARRDGTRSMILCHNDRPHEPFPFWRQITRRTLGEADVLVGFSEHVAAAVRAMVPGADVRQSPFPYTLIPEAGGDDGRYWDERLGRKDRPVILFFGNVRAYKGLEDLVAALPAVRRAVDATLVVAGSFFESLERYRRQARELGVADHVQFVPEYIPDEQVGGLFARSDVVALPYRSAMGSAVLGQAAVAGRPVVATRVGPLPVMIGDRGVLVPPSDPGALAEGLVGALREPPLPPLPEQGAWDACRDLVLDCARAS